MEILADKTGIEDLKTSALVVPVFASKKMPNHLKKLDSLLDGQISTLFKKGLQDGYTQLFYKYQVVLLNLGETKKFNGMTSKSGELSRWLRGKKLIDFAVLYEFKKGDCRDLAEGLVLGDYSYDKFKSKKDDDPKPLRTGRVLCKAKDYKRYSNEIKKGVLLGESVNYARDLINGPSNLVTPEYMEKQAKELAKLPNVSCKILDVNALKKEKMGLLLGVGAGSPHHPCRMVVLHYKKSAKKPTVLVGKGVTFDAGGTNLKPTPYLVDMKDDMGGAAAVFGTLRAAVLLKLPVNLYGIVPLTENIIGGAAVKTGDVLRSAAGKTVEIMNTDAEGRLILADALNYSLRFKPLEMIDIATLTGASIIALGKKVGCLMGTDDKMADRLLRSGENVNELLWGLPLFDIYKEDLKSSIADIKNIGNPGGEAGVVTAGMFLKEFVSDSKWCHIDIGATVLSGGTEGYTVKGASGFGVRLLVDYLGGRK